MCVYTNMKRKYNEVIAVTISQQWKFMGEFHFLYFQYCVHVPLL
jgi:hypothetical protein